MNFQPIVVFRINLEEILISDLHRSVFFQIKIKWFWFSGKSMYATILSFDPELVFISIFPHIPTFDTIFLSLFVDKITESHSIAGQFLLVCAIYDAIPINSSTDN